MITVYGASDDLVEIDGGQWEDEIDCYNQDVRIQFSDGTRIYISYGKPDFGGVWSIKVERKGTAKQWLVVCEDENAHIYSDMFKIDSKIVNYQRIDRQDDL